MRVHVVELGVRCRPRRRCARELGARRRRGRRHVRHRVPRRARRRRRDGSPTRRGVGRARGRGRHPVGRRRPHRRGARRRGARALAPSRSRRASPGSLFEPGRAHAGDVVVADIGIDLGPRRQIALWTLDGVRRRADPARAAADRAQVGVGRDGRRRVRRNDRRAHAREPRAAMHAGAGIVCCGLPGARRGASCVGRRGHHARCPPRPTAISRPPRSTRCSPTSIAFGALALGPGLGADAGARRAVWTLVAASRRCRSCSTPTG